MNSFIFEESNLNDQEFSTSNGVEFNYHYTIEESGCENQQHYIMHDYELPLIVMAMLGFILLSAYLAYSRRFIVPAFKSRSLHFLLFLTYPAWFYHWGSCYKFFLSVNSFHLLLTFMEYIFDSQSGYGKSKYETRKKNEKNARDRKNRAARDKKNRETETKEKRKIRLINSRPLVSQFGIKDVIDVTLDAPDWFISKFGDQWLAFRELAAEFHISLPELDLPNFGKYWTLFKESEVFSEFSYVLRMMISLGFMKKIDFSFKGNSLFVSEPLREKVTLVQFFEKVVSLGNLVWAKLVLAYESGDIDLFFQSEAKNTYDNKYTEILGQKPRIDLGRKADMDDETFDRRVFECIQTTLTLLNTCKPSERGYYSNRLAVLRGIETSRTLAQKDGIRIKPYGILLFGGSGVGKSGIAGMLARYILKVNGFDADPSTVVSLNMEDKFHSEYDTRHKAVIFDDILNTALDRTPHSPTIPIIMFLNNTAMSALNANAEKKGNVMIEPYAVVATTNVKDLMANRLSNEPNSILRRFEDIITQRVMPQYCKTGTEMLDPSKIRHLADQQYPDCFLFTVEESRYADNKAGDKFKSGRTRTIKFVPKYFEGQPLVDVGIATLLRYLKESSARHFAHQRKFVESQRSMVDIPLCDCGLPVALCDSCVLEESDSEEESDVLDSQLGVPCVAEVTEYLSALEVGFFAWLNAFLQTVLASRIGSTLIAFLMRDKLRQIVENSIGYYLICILITLAYDSVVHVRGSWMVLLFTLLYAFYIIARFYMVRRSVIKKFTQIPLPSAYIRDMSWSAKMKVVYFLASLGLWKILVALARKWKTLPVAQAAPPITLQPDENPRAQEKEFWDTYSRERRYQIGDAGMSQHSRTISVDNFTSMIGKKLMLLTKEGGEYCNAVPLMSNVLLIPYHMVTSKTEFVTLNKVGGHTFENMPLDSNIVVRIPGTDLCVWWCPGAGLHKDITEYYPKEILEDKKLDVFTIFNDNGQIVTYSSMTAIRSRVLTTAGGSFSGYKYSFPISTFGGLCMAMLIGHINNNPFIAGHHLAGRGYNGAGGFVTREQLQTAIAQLGELPGTLISHSAAPINTSSMGIQFGPIGPVHPKCLTNALPENAKIDIIGSPSIVSRSSPKSSVVTSLISSNVEKIMGIEKIHGPPKDMGADRHKERDLAGKSSTATRFDSGMLQLAVLDYKADLEKIPDSEIAKLGKLDLDTNLSGLNGVTGINAMNFLTSVGYPGSGPKTQFVQKSDRFVDNIDCVRDLDPHIIEEMNALEEILRRGECITSIFKASIKDEPTKIDKDKARIFAGANLHLTLLMRKYFLTHCAFFQRNRFPTECSVGISVQSPEWTALFKEVTKFGEDRMIGGDYKSFDARMSPQVMFAAFSLLIDLAEKSGNYDKDDLTVMRGLATLVTYPTYEYFGTLVQFMGSNPSGHPLTVIINSMVNSLYLRYCWVAIGTREGWIRIPRFSDCVSATTYGDDNLMSVHHRYSAFNHTAIAAILAEADVEYTMADKGAKSVPFIKLEQASFLKHFAKWDPELQIYRAPVEEDSIAKMLHTHLKSKVLTMEQSSAEAIQNTALKYFEFGREVYELRRSQLEEVARETGIVGYVGPIMSYDERLQWYREKFEDVLES
jgi:hypothetical protein